MARSLKVAVQMDPIETIGIDGDSSFALMLAAQARGHRLWHYEVRHLVLREGMLKPGAAREERLFARARPVTSAKEIDKRRESAASRSEMVAAGCESWPTIA